MKYSYYLHSSLRNIAINLRQCLKNSLKRFYILYPGIDECFIYHFFDFIRWHLITK